MEREISVREYQISRGRPIWTKHSLLHHIEATDRAGVPAVLGQPGSEVELQRGRGQPTDYIQQKGVLSSSKTMVVCIDVTHPSPGNREGAPSVVGVVASIDEKCGQWLASVSCQQSRKEMISELEEMIVQRLRV